MADSPGSELSSHASSEFNERSPSPDVDIDVDIEDDAQDSDTIPHDTTPLRSHRTKRQRTGASSYRTTQSAALAALEERYNVAISSDSSASPPASPVLGPNYVDDGYNVEQVTLCKWKDCTEGDFGNMDALQDHIWDSHLTPLQNVPGRKFLCYWDECERKETVHSNSYAMKAHVRTHTKDRPHFCPLPECDKSFGRMDALTKHLKTTHAPESDAPFVKTKSRVKVPLPKEKDKDKKEGLDPLDLTLLGEQPVTNQQTQTAAPLVPMQHFTEEISASEETGLDPRELYRLLRRQEQWAKMEGERLRSQKEELERMRVQEWMAKEMALTEVLELQARVDARANREQLEMERLIREQEGRVRMEMEREAADVR